VLAVVEPAVRRKVTFCRWVANHHLKGYLEINCGQPARSETRFDTSLTQRIDAPSIDASNQCLAASAISLTRGVVSLDGLRIRRADTSSPDGSHVFSMESRAMRNRLQVRVWGLHLTAEGIVGIAAALLIVIVVVAASRF
jgi:hypothetical protein